MMKYKPIKTIMYKSVGISNSSVPAILGEISPSAYDVDVYRVTKLVWDMSLKIHHGGVLAVYRFVKFEGYQIGIKIQTN